jgi:uncharacterized protein with GYD domain
MPTMVALLIKYNDDQKAGMLISPSNRAEVSANAVAEYGGKLIAAYGSYGEYDMMFIYEMPDQKALAANLHLVDGLGLAKYSKIIPLMPNPDFVESQRMAATNKTNYRAIVDK